MDAHKSFIDLTCSFQFYPAFYYYLLFYYFITHLTLENTIGKVKARGLKYV